MPENGTSLAKNRVRTLRKKKNATKIAAPGRPNGEPNGEPYGQKKTVAEGVISRALVFGYSCNRASPLSIDAGGPLERDATHGAGSPRGAGDRRRRGGR